MKIALQITVNLPESKKKDKSCLLRQLIPKEKAFFQNYVTSIAKIGKIREEL